MDNISLNDKILKLVDQYRNLTNCELPEFNINLFNNKNAFAYLEYEELLQNKNILYIDTNLFAYNDNFVKSIIFHEFTHLNDFNYLKDKFNKIQLLELMQTYSEYHASQIELLSQLYNSLIGIQKRVNRNQKIWYKNEQQSINEHLIYPLADGLTILDTSYKNFSNLSKEEFYKKCSNAKTFMIYYFGKLDVCNKYVQGGVTDLFKKEEPFYQELNQLHLILQNSANVIDKADLIFAYSRYFENAFYQKHSRL